MSILKVTTLVSVCSLFFILAGSSGCAASSDGGSSDQSGALEAETSRKYAAIVGTWNALDAVPPASADGIPSYTTYTFARDGSFTAARGATTVTGSWEIFTTLPTLPRIDMTWGSTRETYVFSLQCDLLVLDGVDALFQHDLASLPVVADGAICEDGSWSSLARCPPDIGDCDHETHRCLQAS
jgi:hypothetical protein